MHEITYHTFVHENVKTFMQGFRYDAHPMGMLMASVGALSTFYPESRNINDHDNRHIQMVRLIAKMPTLGAWAFRHAQGKPYVYPDNDLSYAENFLAMLFKMSEQKFDADERLTKALEILFILHADHEQNCSTNAVRSVGSSQVDPYSAVSAGIAALYGPLHGGANEAVLRMLRRIGSVDNVRDFITGVKNGDERLMGFGHRVYKNYDPRAKIIKKACDDVFEVTGVNPLLEIAVELEKIALEDEYFVKRKLYPNVDFYSGLIYEALSFPPEMFTVLFAIPRTVGLAGAVARAGRRQGPEDRPAQADLHRRARRSTSPRARSVGPEPLQPCVFDLGNVLIRWDPQPGDRGRPSATTRPRRFLDRHRLRLPGLEQRPGLRRRTWAEAEAEAAASHPHWAEHAAAYRDATSPGPLLGPIEAQRRACCATCTRRGVAAGRAHQLVERAVPARPWSASTSSPCSTTSWSPATSGVAKPAPEIFALLKHAGRPAAGAVRVRRRQRRPTWRPPRRRAWTPSCSPTPTTCAPTCAPAACPSERPRQVSGRAGHPALVPDRLVGLVHRAVGAEDQEPVEAAREPAVVGDREHGALEPRPGRPPAPRPTATSRLSVGSSSSSSVAPDSSSSRIWSRACWPPDSDSNRCSAACASS